MKKQMRKPPLVSGSKKRSDFIKDIGVHAIISRWRRIADRIFSDYGKAYRSAGIDFEPRWFTIFYLLHQTRSPLAIMEIAAILRVTHPAVIQTVESMIRNRLARSVADVADRRSRRIALTDKGRRLAAALEPLWTDFERAWDEVADEIGMDMLTFF